MTTPLVGDRRRWRILDLTHAQRQREQLEAQLRGCNLALIHARKIRSPFERLVTVAQVRQRFAAVASDLAAVKAREQAALRDLAA